MPWTRPRWVLAFRLLLGGTGLLPWLLAGHRSVLLEAVFGSTCHRLAERSLSFAGAQMLVCSRCAGIYLGLLMGAMVPAQPWAERKSRLVAACAALPMFFDVLTQDLGLRPSWHPARLATGWLLGFGLMVVALAHLHGWARGPGREELDRSNANQA